MKEERIQKLSPSKTTKKCDIELNLAYMGEDVLSSTKAYADAEDALTKSYNDITENIKKLTRQERSSALSRMKKYAKKTIRAERKLEKHQKLMEAKLIKLPIDWKIV